MYKVKRSDDYLEHHGIKGQKWGKKNGPPYPLGYDDHSVEQKRLNPKGDLNNYDDAKKKSLKNDQTKSKRTDGNEEITQSKKVDQVEPKSSKPLALASKETSLDEVRKNILKSNPNAAIFDPSLADKTEEKSGNNFFQEHKKQIIAAVGAAAVAAGAVYVAKKIGDKDVDIDWDKEFADYEKNLKDAVNAQPLKTSSSSDDLNGFSSQSEKFMAEWFAEDVHRFDPISEEEFASLNDSNDKPIMLQAGQQMFRMAKSNHSSLRDDLEYVSFTPEDRERYKGFLPQMWKTRSFSRIDEVFESSLKAKEEIKAPSKREAIKLMEQAVRSVSPGYSDSDYRSDVLKNFNQYSARMVNRSDPVVRAFTKELQKAGYNAVVDYNDAGRLSDSPLILLNGAKSASVQKVSSVTREEAFKTFQNIPSLSKNKDFSVNDYSALPFEYKWTMGQYLKP